jgi:cytochrome c-type biogenesis protein CcmH/NrfG
MSFDLICPNCGAPSGPSVGVCPFCKTTLSGIIRKEDQTITSIRRLYRDGKIDRALVLSNVLEREKPKMLENVGFLLLFAKILIETEGATSKIRNLLTKAFLLDPENEEASEYLEIIDAKTQLKKGLNDLGEQTLKNIIRRSPTNPHALFLLGTHLFWTEGLTSEAIKHLERCLEVRPNFLRAWACLGTIYRQIGQPALAVRAFRRCTALETNQRMRDYFKGMIESSRSA